MNCPKCLNKYSNQSNIPRILNKCGHTFCEECLISISCSVNKSQSEGSFEVNAELDSSIPKTYQIVCPNCNLQTVIDEVSYLTKNLALLENVLAVNTSTAEPANNMSTSLNSSTLSTKKSARLVCSNHSKDLEAYCETDKMMLCVSCILENDHKNHDLSSIDKAAQKERANLESGFDKILKLEEYLKDNLNLIQEKTDSVKNLAQERVKVIENFFSEILDYIEDREILLKEKIMHQLEEEVEYLRSVKDTVGGRLLLVDNLKNFKSNFDSYSEFEILSKSKENQKILKEVSKNVPQYNQNNVKFSDLSKEEEISNFKKFLYKLLKNKNEEMINVNQQIANVQEKIDKLEKDALGDINIASPKKHSLKNLAVDSENFRMSKNNKNFTLINKPVPKETKLTNSHSKYLNSKTLITDKNNHVALSGKQSNKILPTFNSNFEVESFNFVKKQIDNETSGTTNQGAKKLALFPSLKMKNNTLKYKSSQDVALKESKSGENLDNEQNQNSTGSNQDNKAYDYFKDVLNNEGDSEFIFKNEDIVEEFKETNDFNNNTLSDRENQINSTNFDNLNFSHEFKTEFIIKPEPKSEPKIEIKSQNELELDKNNLDLEHFIMDMKESQNMMDAEREKERDKEKRNSNKEKIEIYAPETNFNKNCKIKLNNRKCASTSCNETYSENKKVVVNFENDDNVVNIDLDTIKGMDIDNTKMSVQITKSFQMDLASLYKNTSSFLLVVGGKADYATRKYCLDTSTWITPENIKESLQVERSDFGAVMYKDKKILIVGGKVSNQIGSEIITDTIELLNTNEQTIRKLEIKMKHPRTNFGVLYMNSKLCVAGGFNGRDVLNNVEFFDQRNKMWIDLPKMLFKRKEFAMVSGIDNCIYSLGGSDEKE